MVQHFHDNHTRGSSGRFMIPLPRKPDAKQLGESRSAAVRRFFSLERSLSAKGLFGGFDAVMREYLDLGHAEAVPEQDLRKPSQDVYYFPIHLVKKDSSTTTKLRAVFDASAKTATSVSLNDQLLVGPTVHSSLIDVLLRFRWFRVALTTDVSKMYRCIELVHSDRDFHRFMWRSDSSLPLVDYRMTRLTFGVSASCFAANMAVKQNASDHALEYPLAAKAVDDNFYVDDGLSGADTVAEAVTLQNQLQQLFGKADFLLRKWNSSSPEVLEQIPSDLRDVQDVSSIPDGQEYSKTLGMQWHSRLDHFSFTVSSLPLLDRITKRALVSDVAKVFDVLGWYVPVVVKMKILLQRVWELKVSWDDVVPDHIRDVWCQWRTELPMLEQRHIQRCYFPKEVRIVSIELHGFSDASEEAYAGVVYIRGEDSNGKVHVALVTAKSKVAPIRRLTIPRLELCGAHLLAQLLFHVKEVFDIPLSHCYAWTDSTIVLNWLVRSSRRFKIYVGNRVSHIVELIAPDRWSHVSGAQNPADCGSRGLFPSELINHDLWWSGPKWLYLDPSHWPKQCFPPNAHSQEADEVCLHVKVMDPLMLLDHYSSFNRVKRVTAWIRRFIHNCQTPVSVSELNQAEAYWLVESQQERFATEMDALRRDQSISNSSPLVPFRPFLDSSGVLRVGGREQLAPLPYHARHPAIIDEKHQLVKLIIRTEHLRLMHAGPTLLSASLSQRYHITARPRPPMMGQLPLERITPDAVFDRVGLDYAGPLLVKFGHVRRPTVVKCYVCVFVSLSVKAIHLELVSDLTTQAFIAALRRFIARRGKPRLLWSDHGSNFVGAAQNLAELVSFLSQKQAQGEISDFCSSQSIEWRFIPQHAPHFGGLWEAAVKSFKTHLKKVMGNVKLTFEELTTTLTQIESCLNSRPLVPRPSDDDDGVEVLTPGHFLIGRPLEALPDPGSSYRSLNLLRRWDLCQALTRHFWKRWSTEYLSTLRKFAKWHRRTPNLAEGDVVLIREDGLVPTHWPIARVTSTHAGKDGVIRVCTLKTPKGIYTRPAAKLVPLLPVRD